MLLRIVNFLHSLSTKSLFKIFFIIYVKCILFYVNTADLSENISENIFNYSEYFTNESSDIENFNHSLDLFNITSNITLSNLTDENNASNSDLVVTEEKTDVNQNYLSFTTSDEDICSCDLNTNACDINCCCDIDCGEEDIKVFSRCHFQPLIPDPNYCYQKDIIFRNNTVYKMQKDPESSLLCIIHDNLKRHLQFKELPAIKSHRDLDLLLKYQSKYINSWSDDHKSVESVYKELKAGSPLYIDSTSEEFKISKIPWSFPSPCFTRMCSCNHEIKYLEDFDSFCSRQIRNLKDECLKNKYFSAENYSNFCIKPGSLLPDLHARLKDLISHTKEMNSNNGLYKQENSLCIRSSDSTPPQYSVQKNICSKVVRGVHFTVVHNGFSGIHYINVSFEYTELNTQTEAFLQHFSVNFKWNNITDTRRRSGNPGYHVGLPIFVGTNTTASELDDIFEIHIEPNGLSVLDKDQNSLCSNNRKSVKFGKNLKTGCIFTFSKLGCRDLQEQIENILLGPTKKKVFIGVFGNANESNIDDWIEAYHEYSEITYPNKTCPVITDLRINVVYAAVGTVVNPQFKILGVGYHYEKSMIEWPCSPCPNLKLSTSVSFFDVTEPAIPHYPKIPSIKANLPNDFFYPFLYGTGIRHTHNINMVIFLFTSLLFIYHNVYQV